MRNEHEQSYALECLRLAVSTGDGEPIPLAEQMLAFVLGDGAQEKIDAVREAVR
jgi:hypothetical protein